MSLLHSKIITFHPIYCTIMKRHSEHTKHIFKYLASESNKHCKYGECYSSQHSCLFFFQGSYFSPEKLLYEFSSRGHLLTFFVSCIPKDSPVLVLKCCSQISPHYCFKTSYNMDLHLLPVDVKPNIVTINKGNQQ